MTATTTELMRAWQGPALLSYGFRPLFLGAALWATLPMALWIAVLTGRVDLHTRFAPVDWHAHALLYGYLPAVIAGFLLTAVPNWTGRLPIVGWPLLGLVLVWLAGRAATSLSALLPAGFAAPVDLAFLTLLAAVIGREIAAGRNWRNLPILAALALLWTGNLIFHLDSADGDAAQGPGARIGIAVAVFLILLIGGRIVPSFTRNWLARCPAGPLPVPPGRFDLAALLVAGLALAVWCTAPGARASGLACLAAGILHLLRLARWAGWRTLAEPLVAILHVGYAFAALGFLAVAIAILVSAAVAPGAALHGWTTGAAGVMTLAVMTRASLGHTGQPLAATPATLAIYAAAVAAAVLRLIDGFVPGLPHLLTLAGLAWILAFGGFALAYGGLLIRPRAAPRSPQPRQA
jgi:uncharacterized protein involved in response to NO